MEFFNSLASQFHAFVLSVAMFIQVIIGVYFPTTTTTVVVTPPALGQTATTSVATSTVVHQATTTARAIVAKSATVISPKPAIKATTPPSASTPVAEPTTILIPTEQLNSQTRPSLVNILCTTKAGGSFAPISGSGVIIDTRGVILTNAHVAQFFLLRDYSTPGNIQCVVRTGSPATPTYTAELLYLPPAWVNANASQITSQQAMGTGENDFAFLRITGTVSSNIALPSTFPSLAMSTAAPAAGTQVLLAAYPAGFLDGATIQMNLYASSALSAVQELYTFNDPTNVDLIALGGSVVAQSGSSGGAVVSASSGKLVGLIATESEGTTTSSRILNAITLAHINRSLVATGFGGISGLLSANLQQQSIDFAAETAPGEIKTIEAVLNKVNR